MQWFFYLISVLAGIVFGMVLMTKIIRRVHGTLKVNTQDPEKELYRIEVLCDLDEIPKYKYIVLKVVKEN